MESSGSAKARMCSFRTMQRRPSLRERKGSRRSTKERENVAVGTSWCGRGGSRGSTKWVGRRRWGRRLGK